MITPQQPTSHRKHRPHDQGGNLIFHIFRALVEFEREIIRERTNAGLSAARSRGRSDGRPKVLPQKKIDILDQLAKDPNNSVADICKTLGIGKTTLYRYVSAEQK